MAKFSLFGNLESLVGHHKKIEVDCITVQEGINQLADRFAGLRGELILEDGDFNSYYSILVNGERIEFLDGFATRLVSSDEVTIFPPIAA